jgi:MFS family permease
MEMDYIAPVVATFTFVQCTFLVLGTQTSTWLACKLKSYRKAMLALLCLFVCSQSLYLVGCWTETVAMLFLAQSILGFVYGTFFPISNTWLEQSFQEGTERKQRGTLQSLIRFGELTGDVVGAYLGSTNLGLSVWIFGIGGSLIVLILFHIDNFPNLEVTSRKLSWRGLIEVQSLKVTYPIYFLAIVQGVLLVSGSLYLIAEGTNPTILVIGQWIAIGFMPLFGNLSQKKGNLFSIFIGMIIVILGLIGLIYSPLLGSYSYAGFLIAGILLGIGFHGVVRLGFQNIAQETAHKDKQTEGYSGFLLLLRLGILTGQLFSTQFGHLQTWYISIGIVVLSAFLLFFQRRKLH